MTVKIKHNIFSTGDGKCLKHFLPVWDSFHAYPVHFIKQYKRAVFEFLIAKYARSGKHLALSPDETYLQVHHTWFNYYHWMIESLPRIVRYYGDLDKLVLVLPRHLHEISFVRDSLNPFVFKRIELIDAGWHYTIPRAVISPIKRFCYVYDAALMQRTRQMLVQHFVKNTATKAHRKIYITRLDAQRRKFDNEIEVIDLMKKLGFEIISLENVSLEFQITTFYEAQTVVSIHGAGLSNVLFMQEDSHVVELYRRKKLLFDHKSKVYSNLCKALNLSYSSLACEPSNVKSDFFTGNLRFDELKYSLIFSKIANQ